MTALTPDEAMDRLQVHVHAFASQPDGLMPEQWTVEDTRAAFEEYGVEPAGPAMLAMRHGLVCVVVRDGRSVPVFFETRRGES